VVLAYAKIRLFQEILASDIPDDKYLERVLWGYFPTPLRENMRDRMAEHRLRREIVATEIANEIVNRAGATFVFRLQEDCAADAAHVVRAFLVASTIFDLPGLFAQVEQLDNRVPADLQHEIVFGARRLVERGTRWLLRNRPRPLTITDNIEHFQAGVERLSDSLKEHLGNNLRTMATQWMADLQEKGVPAPLAERVAVFGPLSAATDILDVAQQTSASVDVATRTYFAVGETLDLHWLRTQVNALPRETHWQNMARSALRDDMGELHRELTQDVLTKMAAEDSPDSLVDAWISRNEKAVERCRQAIAEIHTGASPDFTMLSVAMRDLRAMRNAAASSG